MSKRKYDEELEDKTKYQHTLDSDESDNEKEEIKMNPDDIDGEEEGESFVNADEEIKFTPFNLKEELEEGHFDQNGHYHFNKNEEYLDNWLDDIDWVKIKKDENYRKKYYTAEGEYSSDEETETNDAKFDHLSSYKEILVFMKPRESINETLQRLNKSKMKVSTAQRWKMKKQGIVDESSEAITKLTGIVNEILTKTGNMNVYELKYEQIEFKIKEMVDKVDAGPSKGADLDMYADDFVEKEESKINEKGVTFKAPENKSESEPQTMWEYKLTQDENEKLIGPFTTLEMQKKVENGDFKEKNVFVRKLGENNFYSSSRVDFDLYL